LSSNFRIHILGERESSSSFFNRFTFIGLTTTGFKPLVISFLKECLFAELQINIKETVYNES